MISLLLLALIQQPKCPNLTGFYRVASEDGEVVAEIEQTGCERIRI